MILAVYDAVIRTKFVEIVNILNETANQIIREYDFFVGRMK